MVNTTKQISARERARAASLKFYETEKEREKVQLRYFTSTDAVARVYAQRDAEIAAVEERAAAAAGAALADADAAIRELLALRVPRSEVPDRLGCTAADVRRAVEADPEASAEPTAEPSPSFD